ncbi:MAG: hypothetical protein JSU98_01305 [Gemmatimonadales bacterium]|jgi:hypothetical protein|nr:MAG: hypothetical protein JSU98_01305 [Gemmatimonadales bacterium]
MIHTVKEIPGPGGDAGREGGEVPWVETRAGGWFFVNAVLAAPVFMALYPWSVRWLLRTTGILDRPSRILDPVPAVADHLIPVLGWLSIPAAWLVLRNLRMVDRTWARRALCVFLVAHVGTLAYTVSRFLG